MTDNKLKSIIKKALDKYSDDEKAITYLTRVWMNNDLTDQQINLLDSAKNDLLL